jgi:hypothetical protein
MCVFQINQEKEKTKYQRRLLKFFGQMASPPPIIKWWRVSSRVQSHGDKSKKLKSPLDEQASQAGPTLVFPLTTTAIKENRSENFWYTYNVGH